MNKRQNTSANFTQLAAACCCVLPLNHNIVVDMGGYENGGTTDDIDVSVVGNGGSGRSLLTNNWEDTWTNYFEEVAPHTFRLPGTNTQLKDLYSVIDIAVIE